MILETKNMVEEDYLLYERKSPIRHEYIFNTVIEMAGASLIHNSIAKALSALIWFALRNQSFRVFQSDMRTYNPINGSYFYPDIVVSDGEPKTIDNDNLTNPLLVVEVLSPSTAVFDKTDKFIAYRTIESLKEYALIDSEKVYVEIFRKGENDVWTVETFTTIDVAITFQTIQFSVPLTEIYQKVYN